MKNKAIKKSPNKSPISQPVKTTKKSSQPVDATKILRYVNYGSLVLFLLIAFYYLPIHNKNLLIKIQELSLFLPTQLFFIENMKVAGGLLTYLGTFLTQFFYYPWLGSTIFISLLLLVQFLTLKAFALPVKFYTLTFIPSFALLLSLTQLGYLIFSFKSPGYVYSNMLGVVIILVSFMLYKKTASIIVRSVTAALFVLVLYPFLGFYALLGNLLFCIYEGILYKKDKNWKQHLPLAVGILFIILVPYGYYQYYYTQINFQNIYTSGLPTLKFDKDETVLWIPFIALFASLLFFSFFSFKKNKIETKLFNVILVTVIYLFSFYGLYKYSFEDENFQTEIAMDLAIFDNNWNEVLNLADNLKGEPTRLIVMDTNLALQKLKAAGDKMFSYKNGAKPFKKKYLSTQLMQMGCKPLYFQNGKINYCYRWCMEDMVEYGMNVEYLKYMVKCSLLNKEFILAQKYNDVLKKTLFHRSWALKYQKYIDQPNLMEGDAEFKAIYPFMAYDDILDGDSGLLESYLLNSFAYLQGGPPELVEMSLQCTMILKNIDLFWPRFFLYARTHDRIPKHYQEAALLYSYLERKVDVRSLKFDPQVMSDFQELIQMSEEYSNLPEETSKAYFVPKFGKTFWYYYFFVKNIKTT
ncbi:MAG: DUF6057 family protein [Paludibacter sp.]|nr:DUF6057 family protein [Paludibacter sp.]